MLNAQAEETARLDLSHQKEKTRREELEAENIKLTEAVDSLKARVWNKNFSSRLVID